VFDSSEREWGSSRTRCRPV